MIISNSMRFVFVHLHKTGGTTVTNTLAPLMSWNDVVLSGSLATMEYEDLFNEAHGMWKHSAAAEIRSVIGESLWRDYVVFSVVRNPYARVVSTYTWARQRLENVRSRRGLAHRAKRTVRGYGWHVPDHVALSWGSVRAVEGSSSFSEWLRHPALWEDEAMLPQVDRLSSASGDLIVDRILHLERLAEELPALLSDLGVPVTTIGRANVSSGGDWRRILASEPDLALVRDRYGDDFSTFGYPDTVGIDPSP